MRELPKVYDPKQVEKKIYQMWLEGNYFHAERDPAKKPFTIVIPPRTSPASSTWATPLTRLSRTCSSATSAWTATPPSGCPATTTRA